ncbi:MAG TPA: glycerol-3-phosphate 1-O-acyltransferase PlsY [Terricaulis sp.]|nr:glycerol-3-phosphate 1-O-acyltransferase PlsY [Terricaulis sp.]
MLAFYFILAAAGGYLLGSIPFGLVLTRLAGLGDIRAIGSGNIGATNVLRTGRKDIALATLLLDAGKAAIALLLARWIAGAAGFQDDAQTQIGLTAGAFAFLGHCFPVWLGFKGGKGVATYFGLMLAGLPPLGLAVAVIWLAMAMMFRMSSLAALTAVAAAPLLALVGNFDLAPIIFTLVLAALIFWRHHENIARLLAGTEPRFGAKKAEAVVEAEPEPPQPPAEPEPPAQTGP